MIPKPFQKPHPPLWVACSNIQTIGKAGEWGMGALGFTFVTPEAARAGAQVLQQPSEQLAEAGGLSQQSQRRHGLGLHVRGDRRGGRAKAAGWTFFIFALSYYGHKGVDAPGTSDLWKEYQAGAVDGRRRRWSRA